MVGLLYLTSVASLIALSAVLHQLSTSSARTARTAHLPDTPLVPASSTGHSNCCVPDNESQDHLDPSTFASPFTIVSHTTAPTDAISPNLALCFWDSLLSSLAFSDPTVPPLPDPQVEFPSSLLKVGCTDLHSPLPCQNASLAHCRRHTDLTSDVLDGEKDTYAQPHVGRGTVCARETQTEECEA